MRKILKMLIFDCVVIGGGVAGMTAAMYLKRANIDVVIIDKGVLGGQLNNILKIENYPGFLSISGVELAEKIYQQIKNLNITYKYGTVLEIRNENDYKIIKTDLETIASKTVVIASGRMPKSLGLENEKKLIGKGISFCSLCDGPFYKNKKVAIVGRETQTLNEAVYLSELCQEVIIINSHDRFVVSPSIEEELKTKKNIKIKTKSKVIKINEGNDKLKNIVIKTNNQTEILEVDGLFIKVGYLPDLEYLTNLGLNLDKNYIIVDENMRTNIKNIYACGDVIKKQVYQITTAVNDGTIVANSIKRDIK